MEMKFENLKTIDDLMSYIKCFAIPVDTNSVCFMQDIVGHSTEEQLVEWSRKDQKNFYSMLFTIWNWEDATLFWDRNTNYEHNQYIDLKQSHDTLKQSYDILKVDFKNLEDKYSSYCENNYELKDEVATLKSELENRDNEIIKLKAKLYDLMAK